MRRMRIILLVSLCTIVLTKLSGQATGSSSVGLTIPAIALLDIEPNASNINLAFTPPLEAGAPLTTGAAATNNSKWINYTSAITAGGSARTITVRVTNGTLPSGVRLRVQAGAYTGNGAGVLGNSAGLVNIDNIARTVISGIGGCFTGDGAGRGHRLTYTIVIDDYAALNFEQSSPVQITYTISD